jgi:hypothetical protein
MHTKVPQRSKRKKSSEMVATKPLSKRADFNSALMLGVVFAPGLSRGNRPGDTKRDSGHGDQHLLLAHDNLQRLSDWRRREADISLLPDRDQ